MCAGNKISRTLFYFLQKGTTMSHQLLKAEEKEYLDLPKFSEQKHPYQDNQPSQFTCDPADKECVSRLVQAFSDCD